MCNGLKKKKKKSTLSISSNNTKYLKLFSIVTSQSKIHKQIEPHDPQI
jgi:hypothetical protein